MINSFLKFIQYEKRLSQNTVISYQNDLEQFKSFLPTVCSNQNIEQATYQHIRAWVVSLSEDGLQTTSINRKVAALKSYYKFLMKRDQITVDPTMRLKPLKTKKRLPVFVPETSLMELFDKAKFPEGFAGLRDRLVLELLYGTGIRLSELIGIDEKDVDINGSTVKVLGKRNKERIIPIAAPLCNLVHEYIQQKKIELDQNENTVLIVTDKGSISYPVFIYRLVRKYLNYFVTIDKRSPHVLRHTFATHLLNKGADINAVKDLLGHSSLAATQVYTHNSLDKLKTVFKRAHPKA